MQLKTTRRLFKGLYQYKIVLVCSGAGYFRSGDLDTSLLQLKKIVLKTESWSSRGIKTQEELDYCFKLQAQLKKLKDIEVRVESPWLTVYTNSKSSIDALIKVNPDNVKYVSAPQASTSLDANTIVMPKMNYDFRVTVGKTTHEHSAFIAWAESNAKVKLTKSCVRDLSKARSWGGTHFYITGDNNLLMAKMHLGGVINKVERIIKA